MLKLIAPLAAAAAIFALCPTASAQGYGTAGCGLGSIVFGSKPGFVQVFAATTNSTFGTQTFGITSGTSNCTGGVVSVASTRAFVETNREAVAKDIARGSGETLEGLAKLAGCKDHRAMGKELQAKYATIFTSAKISDRAVSENVVKVLEGSKLSCSTLARKPATKAKAKATAKAQTKRRGA